MKAIEHVNWRRAAHKQLYAPENGSTREGGLHRLLPHRPAAAWGANG